MSQSAAAAVPGLAQPAASTPCAQLPANVATLKALVDRVRLAHLELTAALLQLDDGASSGPWRGDLVIAIEKAEASSFWFRQSVRGLQAAKGRVLIEDLRA